MSRPLDCICVCIYIIDKLPRFVDASVVHKRRQTRCLRQGGWTVVGLWWDTLDIVILLMCSTPLFAQTQHQSSERILSSASEEIRE